MLENLASYAKPYAQTSEGKGVEVSEYINS